MNFSSIRFKFFSPVLLLFMYLANFVDGAQLSCGAMNGLRCDPGYCCSSRGYCGKTKGHCGDGCQEEYGACATKKPKFAEALQYQITCGTNGQHCDDGYCCSSRGYCGITKGHCGAGCQHAFGNCWFDPPEPKVKPEPGFQLSCGTNGQHCNPGYCCSSRGYCGKTEGHCGKGCQPMFGYCWPKDGVKKPSSPWPMKDLIRLHERPRIPFWDYWKEPSLLKAAKKRDEYKEPQFSLPVQYTDPDSPGRHIPQTYKTRTLVPLIPIVGPCQFSCSRVKNKAYHGVVTSDVGLVAQALLNALNGLPINLIITLVQCVSIAVLPLGGTSAISFYDLVLLHGPNSVDYAVIIHACITFLDNTVGKKARKELMAIKKYRSASSSKPGEQFYLWLKRQYLRYQYGTNPDGQQCVVYELLKEGAGQSMDDLLPPNRIENK